MEWGHWFLRNDGTCLSHLPGINPRGNYAHHCKSSFRSMSHILHPLRRSSLPSTIVQIVSLADHVFLLASTCESCDERSINFLPNRKFTCVCIDALNKCLVPDSEMRGRMTRPEIISNSHGYVHLYSNRQGYRHIAVIEEGLLFREPADVEVSIKSVKKLLDNDAWTILRFGRRPHFLEGLTVFDSCPTSCICELVDTGMESLCRLKGTGCDLRSAEFYMSSNRAFLKIAERLNDHSQFPSQGGDDLVSTAHSTSFTKVDINVFPSFPDQWLMIPVLSMKKQLNEEGDTLERKLGQHDSIEHQLELHNTYERLCFVRSEKQ